VNGVSKQYKYQSTYSKCHRYVPGHFATFPPGSISTPLSHTRLHLTKGLVWLEGLSFCETPIQLYIHFLSSIYISVFDVRKRDRFMFSYLLSCKGRHMCILKRKTWWWIRLRHCPSNREVANSIIEMILQFYFHLIFRPHFGPAIDTATNRNKRQACLLGIKQKFVQLHQPDV